MCKRVLVGGWGGIRGAMFLQLRGRSFCCHHPRSPIELKQTWEKVLTVRIDEHVKENVLLMKVDVEGCEFQAIKVGERECLHFLSFFPSIPWRWAASPQGVKDKWCGMSCLFSGSPPSVREPQGHVDFDGVLSCQYPTSVRFPPSLLSQCSISPALLPKPFQQASPYTGECLL